MSIKTISRIVGSVIAIAVVVGILLFDRAVIDDRKISLEWGIALGIALVIVAFLITPYVTVVPYRWMREKIRGAAASDLVAAAIGLSPRPGDTCCHF